jgi:type VI protein secretion system component VasK
VAIDDKIFVEKQLAPLIKFALETAEADRTAEYRNALKSVAEALRGKTDEQLKKTGNDVVGGKEDDLGLKKAEATVAAVLAPLKDSDASAAIDFLNQPLVALRGMLTGGGQDQIRLTWAQQIVPAARELEGKFPFQLDSAQDVPPDDVKKFLNPVNGTLSMFFKNQLASSFDGVPGSLKPRETAPVQFTPEFVAYLNTALQLRDALFPSDSPEPRVGYTLTVATPDGTVEADGRVATSASPLAGSWDGKGTGVTLRIAVAGAVQNAPPARSYPGPWGLFHAFLEGAGSGPDAGPYALTWTVTGASVTATLQPSSSASPFAKRLGLFAALRAPEKILK